MAFLCLFEIANFIVLYPRYHRVLICGVNVQIKLCFIQCNQHNELPPLCACSGFQDLDGFRQHEFAVDTFLCHIADHSVTGKELA